MRRTLIAVTAIVMAACTSATPAGSVRPAPTLAPEQVVGALSAAQGDMFANHYTAADAAYQALLGKVPRSADVHAAYALFLNYRHQFSAARMQAAQAAALDPRNGRAQAILCRVDDWSQEVTPALAAGRAAVRLTPRDALTHLFLSEALADSGDTSAAQREIDASTPLLGTHPLEYLLAERQREMANLAGDLGNQQAQVAAFQAARDAQPGWLYRIQELVDAQLNAGDDAAARQALDAAAQQSPDDAETLATLGADAFFVGDAHAAALIWAKAQALAPHDASVLDMAGEMQVAANHDINAAIADFESALAAAHNDHQAAAYLLALARYVQHDEQTGFQEILQAVQSPVGDGRPGHLPSPPDPDAVGSSDAQQALGAVNAARAAAGLRPVSLDAHLSASADAHSFYWLFNNLSPTVANLGIHQETPGLPGYSGRFPWTRSGAFGYPGQHVGEDITHHGAPVPAVGDWVNSVYHRFAIMRPDLVAIGYGEAELGSLLMEDMEFGFGVPTSTTPVLYPGAGQTGVPTSFFDNELPDPVPQGAPRTTGYPVTVTFSAADAVQMSSFTLSGADGAGLQAYLLAPSGETENSASLLPVAPLHPATTYTAHIVASVNGVLFDRSWAFTTSM